MILTLNNFECRNESGSPFKEFQSDELCIDLSLVNFRPKFWLDTFLGLTHILVNRLNQIPLSGLELHEFNDREMTLFDSFKFFFSSNLI